MGEKPSRPQHHSPYIFLLSCALTNAPVACNIRAASSGEGIDAKLFSRRMCGIAAGVLIIRTTACGAKRASADQPAQQHGSVGGSERALTSEHSRHVGGLPGQEETGLRGISVGRL